MLFHKYLSNFLFVAHDLASVFETLDLLHVISSYRLYMQWFLPVPGDVRPTTSVTCACSKVRRELEMLEEKMMRQVLRLQASMGPWGLRP